MNGFERDLNAFEKEIVGLKLEKQNLEAKKQDILDKIWDHKISIKNAAISVEDESKKKRTLKRLLTRKKKLKNRKKFGKLVFILTQILLIVAFLLGGGIQFTILTSIINLLLGVIYNKQVNILIEKTDDKIEKLNINETGMRMQELSRTVLKDNLFSETLKFDLNRIENEIGSVNEKIAELERQYNIVLEYYAEVKDELSDDLSFDQRQGTINSARKTLIPIMLHEIYVKND